MSKKIYLLIKVFLVISAITAIARAGNITVRKTTDTNNQLPCGNYCSLREAINKINESPFAGASRIDFAIPPDDQRDTLRGGGIDIGAFELNSATYTASFGGLINQPYSQTITTDNFGSAYCISSGALPAALSGIADFSPTLSVEDKLFSPQAQFVITGTPTQPEIYDFTFRTSSGANSLTTNCRIVVAAPTAASVAVGGRILTHDGRCISAARISIINQNCETRTALTNPFGYYHFNEIQADETYIFSIAHKRYQFADNPRLLTVLEAIQNADFIAESQF